MVTIGLGASFIGTLYFIQGMLMERVSISGRGNQANMVLFDIQTSQQQPVVDLTRQFGLPVLQKVPIVTMRIDEINGRTAIQALQDTSREVRRRAFESELRVTYRDSLLSTEKILSGKLGTPVRGPGDPVQISLEDGYARWLHVKIGDSIVFNVQGMLIPTVIGSIRDVDWRHLQTNFRIVFPTGVLEQAPQFYVVVTRVPSAERSALFQRSVVQHFPNVSIIDLGLVLSVLDDVLDKIAFVIRFMAAFSIITGLIVLIASVLISKYQRIQESVLLRTLGASRRQILVITTLEYFFLGTLASATGLLLSIAASMALAKYNFDSKVSVNWLALVIIFSCLTILIILIGLWNSRDVINKPPLEILREES
jgi:putative ABC transport system permease protein